MKFLKLFEDIDAFEEDDWDDEEFEKPKKNSRYRIIYANNLGDLQLKSMGLNHDHAHHVYFGRTNRLPQKLQIYANENPYLFIYYEDIPAHKR